MSQKDKLKPSEHANRAIAAMSQGTREAVLPGAAGVGLLALAPLVRDHLRDTSHVPEKFKTKTVEDLAKLTEKLLRAGGRDPNVGRTVELIPMSTPGYAKVVQEYGKIKGGRAPRDFLHLGLNATPESIAHEVGHITPESSLGKVLSRLSPLLRKPIAQMAPGLLAATALLSKPGEEPSVVAKAAPYVGGIQMAAILGEEVRANTRAMNLLKRIGYNPTLKQQLLRHASALTYLPYGAALIGAPLGILAGIKAFDRGRAKNRPMPTSAILARGPKQLADAPSAQELKEKWVPFFKNR